MAAELFSNPYELNEDTQLVCRAMREGWGTKNEVVQHAMQQAADIAQDGDRKAKHRLVGIRVFSAVQRRNLTEFRLELLRLRSDLQRARSDLQRARRNLLHAKIKAGAFTNPQERNQRKW